MTVSLSKSQNPGLASFVGLDGLKEICRGFTGLYGIGIRIFDASGKRMADTRGSTGEHCGYLYSVHPTRLLCSRLVGELRTRPLVDASPVIASCFSGLRYHIFPLEFESRFLGRVIFGPFAPEALKEPPKSLQEHDGLSLAILGQHLKRVPHASKADVDQKLAALRSVLLAVIQSGYKVFLTNQMHLASMAQSFADIEASNTKLSLANKRLQELEQMKSNFVGTVSHELRTPLTSVIGYSEMLLENLAGELTTEQRDYVATILRKGEDLLALITSILDLTRAEQAHTVLRVDVDILSLWEDVRTDVYPQAVKKNVKLELDYPKPTPTIKIDRNKIHRVLTNLLGNAVKFSTAGKITIRIRLVRAPPVDSTHLDIFEPYRNQYLSIEVIDEGPGINAEALPHVFDAFYQVDGSSTRSHEGAGLGLSIARSFVEAHKGKITVESEEGIGTTFRLLLPYYAEPIGAAVGMDGLE